MRFWAICGELARVSMAMAMAPFWPCSSRKKAKARPMSKQNWGVKRLVAGPRIPEVPKSEAGIDFSIADQKFLDNLPGCPKSDWERAPLGAPAPVVRPLDTESGRPPLLSLRRPGPHSTRVLC